MATMSTRVWLLGRNKLESECLQIKEAPEGKNFLTRNNNEIATNASKPNAASNPKKNNPPVNKLSVWMLAKAIGNNPIRIIAVNLAFEKILFGWKSARKTVKGGTNRTEMSGSIENNTDTTAPKTKPCNTEIHEIENPTSTGSKSLNKIGISC